MYSSDNQRKFRADSNFGMNLKKVNWSNVSLYENVGKAFHEVSNEAKNQDPEQVRQFREALDIKVTPEEGTPNPLVNFKMANFPSFIAEGLREMKFTKPTPIQSQGWPIAFTGKNLIGVAETGSGKTLAFLLPAILHVMKLKEENRGNVWPKVVVLSPTRELAQQIFNEFYRFTQNIDISASCVYGGSRRFLQRQNLAKPNDIIIGTPGRVIDFLQSDVINMTGVTMFIVDEADRMLDMGFEKQLRRINSQIPPKRQTLFFTATWPKEVISLASDFVNSPVKINVGSLDTSAVHSVRQNVLVVDRRDKFTVMMETIVAPEMEKDGKVLIFASSRKTAIFLYSQVAQRAEQALLLHGGMAQEDRERVLTDFRKGVCSVLVATDVAQRGLDIPNITKVVNYDFPNQIEDYVHRIGRTGRAGKEGVSHTFFTRQDESMAGPLIRVLEEAGQEVPEELKELAENGSFSEVKRMFPKPWEERTEEEKEEYFNTPIEMNLDEEIDNIDEERDINETRRDGRDSSRGRRDDERGGRYSRSPERGNYNSSPERNERRGERHFERRERYDSRSPVRRRRESPRGSEDYSSDSYDEEKIKKYIKELKRKKKERRRRKRDY